VRVHVGDGRDADVGSQPVADIDISWWCEKGVLLVLESAYKVYREGVMSGAFVLESEGTILVRAIKPSVFLRSFIIEHAGKQYTLRSASGRKCRLLDGDREVGALFPETIFTRRTNVDLPEDLPLPVRIFILWLVIILWKRDSDSAASVAAFAAAASSIS
jgi:hypothetical protein